MLEKIILMLNKPTPDNVTIVGPKHYGKSVFLNHLSEELKKSAGFYTSVYIDLRHKTPQSDIEFRRILADHLVEALRPINSEYSDTLRGSDDSSILDVINYIFEDLKSEKKRLVIIFDAFDCLALGTLISPNLLDQLRTLATDNPSLALVTGSRLRLRELCKTEESRTSDFWRIFVEPIQIGAFDDSDFDEFWQVFTNKSVSIESGAKTELKGQSGGIPILTAGIMNKLYEKSSGVSKITHADILEVSKIAQDGMFDIVNDLWEDCSQELRNLLVDAGSGDANATSYSQPLIEDSINRGFTRKDGAKIKSLSRIIEDYVKTQSTSVRDMNLLFSQKKDYEKNIKTLLELRLAQLPQIFDELRDCAVYCIKDLDDNPRRVLSNARGVVEEAIKVILTAEGCSPGDRLPNEFCEDWRRTNIRGTPEGVDPFPLDRGQQVRAISYLCGCESSHVKVSKKISRMSVSLLRNVNSFGNFLNHRGTEEPSYGYAILFCFTTIELIESLEKDTAPALG